MKSSSNYRNHVFWSKQISSFDKLLVEISNKHRLVLFIILTVWFLFQGERGEKGPQGSQGNAGASVSFVDRWPKLQLDINLFP